MGLYNFHKRFVPAIRARIKKHTIRNKRKYPDKPGNKLHLYVGLRHPGAELISREECVKVEDIEIREGDYGYRIWIEGHELSASEKERLSIADGFKGFADMMAFWEDENELPFHGDIIHWK